MYTLSKRGVQQDHCRDGTRRTGLRPLQPTEYPAFGRGVVGQQLIDENRIRAVEDDTFAADLASASAEGEQHGPEAAGEKQTPAPCMWRGPHPNRSW